MDPGFHRGDDKNWIPFSAGMTETRVDFQSKKSEPLGLEPKVVRFVVAKALAVDRPTACS
jgi:hypothetical protein